VPCFKNGEQLVTQYYKDDVELAGLVKYDFLGLKTLTVIDIAEKLINARPDHGALRRFEISKLRLDDALTFTLLQSGETTGVFQLESSGMQQLFKDLKPDAFEDIVAAVALHRPGLLGIGMVRLRRLQARQAHREDHDLRVLWRPRTASSSTRSRS
jgi:DNA polymerase-3 subunit alpha